MASRIALKDPQHEQRQYGARTLFAVLAVLFLLSVLVARYYTLQIRDYETYSTASERNRVQLQPLPPKRGLIFDRNGVLLADNRPSYTLSLVVERVPDLDATLAELAALVDRRRGDIEKFRERVGQRRPYEHVPLRFRLDDVEQARIAVNRHRLPGVVVDAQLQRTTPTGRCSPTPWATSGASTPGARSASMRRTTAAPFISARSVSSATRKACTAASATRPWRPMPTAACCASWSASTPQPGKDLVLHLDFELQRVAHHALAGRRGAVVAIDPLTGGVLALVSTPSFDSNLFVNGISSRDYNALRDSPDVPLFNRTVQGQYPPGIHGQADDGHGRPGPRAHRPEFTVPIRAGTACPATPPLPRLDPAYSRHGACPGGRSQDGNRRVLRRVFL
jgi:penicillin-binding protein 2